MFAFLVQHRPTVMLVVLCITVFGAFTYIKLPREAAPEVEVPYIMVVTPYIGVAPKDIESLVTMPLETELSGVKDLKKMTSTSAEGASMIFLEFEPEVVLSDAMQRVRDRVNRGKSELPKDAEEPDVRELNFSELPIMIVTIAGPADEEQLKKIGERLEDDFGAVKGVLEAKLTGGRTREIRVQINPHRLQHYSLSMNDVIGAISAENVNIPGGDVSAGAANYLLRVPGEFTAASEIEDVAVKRVGDRPVFIRDIGEVIDGFADRSTYSRMNGQPAVSVSVSKRTGENLLVVADRIKEIAAEHEKSWPEGVTYQVLGDQSRFIRDIVTELENNIATALILVIAVILFFMGARNSLFVAVSIPLSMLLGYILIWAFGMTLNMIVLFSLILALGMLVDNAIVLVENIYRHVEEGEDLVTASVEGSKEVAGAVAASTATTVAAFLPLVFWSGIMGQFMGYMPKTVIIVLVSSLFVAVGILPVLTSKVMKRSKTVRDKAQRGTGGLMGRYRALLSWSIRHRYITALLVTSSLVGTIMAYGVLNHGTEFLPDTEPDQASIAIRAPDGTDLEETDRVVREVEAILDAEENVDVYVIETGVAAGGSALFGSQAAANQARITVDFLKHRTKAKEGDKVRIENTRKTIASIRAAACKIAGATITVEKRRMGPRVGKPIAVEVSGDNFEEAGKIAAHVRRDLSAIAGATDLNDDYRVGRPEMRLRIDRGAAKRVGASTGAVASTIRTAVAGTKASSLRDGEDEYDIKVALGPRFKNDLQSILAMRIPGRIPTSPNTFPVPLSAVASYELAGGSGSIRHIDQDLVVTVTGDVAGGFNENAVRAEVVKYIETADMPEGYRLRLGGANDEQKKTQEFLGNAFLICLFLIALVLVSQFNSYSKPLIILFSVVLSMVGVLWGLVITGTSFGVVMTGLGVISLAGVVVNNAIVLLDYVEKLRARGLSVFDALVEAGVVRFRPVMLTAITTILGLAPMGLGITIDFAGARVLFGGPSAEWWGPMANAVIFGLAFATILTLVVVPALYMIIEDVAGVWDRAKARVFGKPDELQQPASAGADAE